MLLSQISIYLSSSHSTSSYVFPSLLTYFSTFFSSLHSFAFSHFSLWIFHFFVFLQVYLFLGLPTLILLSMHMSNYPKTNWPSPSHCHLLSHLHYCKYKLLIHARMLCKAWIYLLGENVALSRKHTY